MRSRMSFEIRRRLEPHLLVAEQDLRVLLEEGRNRHKRRVLCHHVEHDGRARDHSHVGAAGDQNLGAIHLRAALLQLDVETVGLVGAVGDGLVEATVLGLGAPAGEQPDLVRGMRRPAGEPDQRRCQGRAISEIHHDVASVSD